MNRVAPSAALFPGERLSLTPLENLLNTRLSEPLLVSEGSKKQRINKIDEAARRQFVEKQLGVLPRVIDQAPKDIALLTLSFCSLQTLGVLKILSPASTAKFTELTQEVVRRKCAHQKIFTLETTAAKKEFDDAATFLRCSDSDLFAQMKKIQEMHMADSLNDLTSMFSSAMQFPDCTSLDLSSSLGSNSTENNDSILVNLLKSCPALTTLKIKQCSISNFDAIARSCYNLTALDCSNVSTITGAGLVAFLKNCRNLTSIIHRCSRSNNYLEALIPHAKGLREISFGEGVTRLEKLAVSFPQLTSLGLHGNPNLNDATLMAIVQAHPKLEELNLAYTKVTGNALVEAAPFLSNLRKINLTGMNLTDANVLDFVTHTKRLEVLDLCYNEKLTDGCLDAIATCTELSVLKLDHCYRMSFGALSPALAMLEKLREFSIGKIPLKDRRELVRFNLSKLHYLGLHCTNSILQALPEKCPNLLKFEILGGRFSSGVLQTAYSAMRKLQQFVCEDSNIDWTEEEDQCEDTLWNIIWSRPDVKFV